MTPISQEESARFDHAMFVDLGGMDVPTPTSSEREAAFEAAEAVVATLEHDLGCLHPFRADIAASIHKATMRRAAERRRDRELASVPTPKGMIDRHTLTMPESDGATPHRFGLAVQDLFRIACEEGVGVVLNFRLRDEIRTLAKACVHCDDETRAWIPKLYEAINEAIHGPDHEVH